MFSERLLPITPDHSATSKLPSSSALPNSTTSSDTTMCVRLGGGLSDASSVTDIVKLLDEVLPSVLEASTVMS